MKAPNTAVKALIAVLSIVILLRLVFQLNAPSSNVRTLPVSPDTSEYYSLVADSVTRGHTFQVKDDHQAATVQLCGLYIPEPPSALATSAKEHLQSLLSSGDGEVILTVTATDETNRALVDAFVPTGNGEAELHLNSEMVAAGMAYISAQAATDCINTTALALAQPLPRRIAEESAVGSGLGVWASQ